MFLEDVFISALVLLPGAHNEVQFEKLLLKRIVELRGQVGNDVVDVIEYCTKTCIDWAFRWFRTVYIVGCRFVWFKLFPVVGVSASGTSNVR